MKRFLPLTFLLAAGCGSAAVVRTGLTARPSPIEVNGLKIEARMLAPVYKGAKVHQAQIVATAPSRWSGPFELFVYNRGDRKGTGGFIVTGTYRAQTTGVIDPDVANGDPRIYGRATRFETADEEITLSGAVAVESMPGQYQMKLEEPVTVTTPSGLRVTFPRQVMGTGQGPLHTVVNPSVRVKCLISRQGRVAAFGARVPADMDPRQISITPLHKRSYFPSSDDPAKEVELELWFDHPTCKTGPLNPLSFKIRHRADLEVIPFAVIATR